MSGIFDGGFGAEELAMALGLAEEIAEEERERLRLSTENEPLVPDENEPEWYERD